MTHCSGKINNDLLTEVIHENSASTIITDVPADIGGSGSSFSPTDLLGVSLASCMLTTMGIVAKKEGVSIDQASFKVEKHMTTELPRKIAHLVIECKLPESTPAHIRDKLESTALSCPVHHSIHPDIKLSINFTYTT